MRLVRGLRGVFGRYWRADFLASCGGGLRLAAFPLLAAALTPSPTAVAAVVAAQGLPWLVVGPAVGVVVDRHDLRRAMVIAQAVQIVVIAAVAMAVVVGTDDLPLLYGAALVTGLASTLRASVAQTAVPRLIARDELAQANGRLAAGQLVGSELLGPASAGSLFGIAAALPLAFNAGATAIAMLLLLTLPGVFAVSAPVDVDDTTVRSAVGDLREGLRWIVEHRIIAVLVVTVAIVAVADAAWFAVLVLYVRHILRAGPGTYGLLLAFGALGGITASAACARLSRRFGSHRLMIATIVTMAATQLVLGLVSSVLAAAAMLAISSAAFAIFNITAVGIRQRQVPARLLGRVNSAYLAVGLGAESAGAILGGVIAAAAGIRAPMLIGAPPLIALAISLCFRPPPAPVD